MPSSASANRDGLRQAIDIFRTAARPFIVRAARRIPGRRVETVISGSLNERRSAEFDRAINLGESAEDAIDVNDFPHIVLRNWREAFAAEFRDDRAVQNALWLIADARNKVFHPARRDMELGYVQARAYLIAETLGRINCPDEKREVESIAERLSSPPAAPAAADSAPPTEQPAPRPRRRAAASLDLEAWRTVMPPRETVTLGEFTEAEFAADLQQVRDGRADSTDYGNPVGFFNQTYITPGIRALLVSALKRVGGGGGDPVIQTKTGFGGGKTHSLIALYHLIGSADALINPARKDDEESRRTASDIRAIMSDAGYNPDSAAPAKIAVLDGTYLSETDVHATPDGDPLNTLWGEMAHQLGGKDAYEIIGAAARSGASPGGRELDALLEHVGPCVILMDELVAYVRNAPNKDSVYTFLQALTQSVRRSDDCALVVTLPQSEVEAGGDEGAAALARLDSIFARIEAVWEPLEIHEAFEVVRRRLFGNAVNESERDKTCDAFARMYSRHKSDFPQETAEQRYAERMKACYPIHPEIFDRLYQDWSTNPNFQRTRGVLRMMANWVSRLFLNSDQSPLILPASMPLDDPSLSNEFTRLLPGQWSAVVSEAGAPDNRADAIDKTTPRFAEVGGASRRIARTVFLGSAVGGATRGIERRRVHLGTAQPGHGIAVYDEALRGMEGSLYYLYHDRDRYFFHAEENLNKVASDRESEMTAQAARELIIGELRTAAGNLRDVIVCPDGSAAVPEAARVRMVVLPPDKTLPSRSAEDDYAEQAARAFISARGEGAPRVAKNTIVFLAAKSDEARALARAARRFRAWDSILEGERRILNLIGSRKAQAAASRGAARRELDSAMTRAYKWALAPNQPDPARPEYGMSRIETDAPDSGDIIASAFRALIQQEALIEKISPAALSTTLSRYIWNNPRYGDRVALETLWEMMANNIYMHRLRDKSVLLACVGEGVESGAFGYAESVDEYGALRNLKYAEPLILPETAPALGSLIAPDTAREAKRKAESQEEEDDDERERQEEDLTDGDEETAETDFPPRPPGPSRIAIRQTARGAIDMNAVSDIQNEIIRNLDADGGEVTVEITITAAKPEGFSETATRSVRENSEHLGLEYEQR